MNALNQLSVSVTRTAADEFKVEFSLATPFTGIETLVGQETDMSLQTVKLPQIPVAPDGDVWAIRLLGIDIIAPQTMAANTPVTDQATNPVVPVGVFRWFALALNEGTIQSVWDHVNQPTVQTVLIPVPEGEPVEYTATIAQNTWPHPAGAINTAYQFPNLAYIVSEDYTGTLKQVGAASATGTASGIVQFPFPESNATGYAEVFDGETLWGNFGATKQWDTNMTTPVSIQVRLPRTPFWRSSQLTSSKSLTNPRLFLEVSWP